jgi:hypothetical protein
MKMKTILGLSTVALALALGEGEASADHIYQLSGVTFNLAGGAPAGTATGTFTTDDAITALLDYDDLPAFLQRFRAFGLAIPG